MTRISTTIFLAAALAITGGLAHAQGSRATPTMGAPTSPLTPADQKAYLSCRYMTYAQINASPICKSLIAHHPELAPVAPPPAPPPTTTPKPK